MLLVCFCFFYGWIYVHNQPGLQALSPFPTLHLPPSRSDTSVTPSVSRRVHTWRQPIDFLGAHLWLQSSGRSTSGWRTTWGLFVWECFFFFFWNVFLADKTTALWHSGGSWRSASAGQHFPARHRQQQDCGSQCLSGCSVMAMTEAKDPEIHVDVSLDFSLNNISSNQLSHRFTFAGCFPVQRCCAAFSFYCDKVKIAKRWKIQEVRANINFSLNHGGAV